MEVFRLLQGNVKKCNKPVARFGVCKEWVYDESVSPITPEALA